MVETVPGEGSSARPQQLAGRGPLLKGDLGLLRLSRAKSASVLEAARVCAGGVYD